MWYLIYPDKMSAIVTALDSYTTMKIGEKGHAEYGWSNDIREKIIQFNFQLIRTDKAGINRLQIFLKELLISLNNYVNSKNIVEREIGKGLLCILYKMIGHTRDIIDGKGEYSLTYMMIYTWYDYYPELAKFALKCLVDLGDNSIHQYGTWKDIKYFCEYCKANAGDDHPLILYAIFLTNEQLRRDYATYISNSADISLAAKWVPREKSAFSWLYEKLAIDYFNNYMTTTNYENHKKAILKCKTEYRKLISDLNRKLDTIQIKQCAGKWSDIDFDKTTSITLLKQKKAFLNMKKNGEVRYPDNRDRILCADNFNNHIQKSIKDEKEVKGKRIGMADFTKQALQVTSQAEIELLNSQWRDNSTQTSALENMIAMVDVSGSMMGDPMDVAIALGIRIAEKSALGKRVMTFSAKPTWINLENIPDFVSQVKVIKNAEWGMNTNFYAALDMILDAIIKNKMDPADVQDMILVILSDMQIDQGDNNATDSMFELIKKKYEDAGIRVHGKPYKPPHILFWNLRSTRGFPLLSNQKNASMISGFSPLLLNLFCEKGLDALSSCTPWSILEKCLENNRYKIMRDKFVSFIQ